MPLILEDNTQHNKKLAVETVVPRPTDLDLDYLAFSNLQMTPHLDVLLLCGTQGAEVIYHVNRSGHGLEWDIIV